MWSRTVHTERLVHTIHEWSGSIRVPAFPVWTHPPRTSVQLLWEQRREIMDQTISKIQTPSHSETESADETSPSNPNQRTWMYSGQETPKWSPDYTTRSSLTQQLCQYGSLQNIFKKRKKKKKERKQANY